MQSEDKAYEFLKSQILGLQLRSGERMITEGIAGTLGISRTPVRQALGRLAQEGLLSRDSGWGYVVRPMSFEEVKDMYKVREALEVEAAKEAIERIDNSSLAQLDRILGTAKDHLDGGNLHGFLDQCRFFHRTIVAVTRNSLLQQMLMMINDRVQMVSAMVLVNSSQRAKEIYDENLSYLNALRQRDANAATLAVREHLRKATKYAAIFLGDQHELGIADSKQVGKQHRQYPTIMGRP